MKKLATVLLLLSFCIVSLSQNISRQEADGLLGTLGRSRADTAQIRLLLQLAKFHIYKPGEAKADLDSGLVFINQAGQLNNSLHSKLGDGNILLHKAYYLKESGQRDFAKASAEKAVAILKGGKDIYLLGEAYAELSQHYSYETELDKKIGLVQLAVACFEQSGSLERKARCYQELADLFVQKGDKIYMEKALEALDSSLRAYQAIKYPALQGVYVLYATVYGEASDHKKALQYALLAVKAAEQVKDTSIQLCQLYNIAGIAYVNFREYEKALPYLENSLAVAEKYRDLTSIYLLRYNLCNTYLELKKAREAKEVLDRIDKKYPQSTDPLTVLQQTRVRLRISMQLKKLEDLDYYCKKLATLVDTADFDNLSKHAAYNSIISGYLQLKRFPLVRNYLKKEQAVLDHLPFSNRNAGFFKQWFALDSATGDYKSAVYHLLAYNKVNDTIFNQVKARQMQQLEVEYQTAEQKKNIELLNEQKRNQDIVLKRSALERKIIIAAAALLLIILFLLFNQFRLKQRSNKVIQKKNAVLEHMVTEKEWLLKEVHHRVKNNLQTVVSLLELQSENLRDEALSAIHDSQNRIYAMSLIHQKLYQTENVASINMQPYLQELTAHLQTVHNHEHKIHFDLQVAAVELDVSQAIPVGLIVNEAVTNSIKYAFNYPAHRPQISIGMKQYKKQSITLTIADNGTGLPFGFDSTAAAGLGFKLMHGLVDDIEGELTVESDDGTLITVVFNASVPFDERVAMPEPEKAFAL